MVDMESRDHVNGDDPDDLLAARHRLETRQDWEQRGDDDRSNGGDMDENGNPTSGSRHIHPIMHNNVRPVSIYRHTPVFRPQKLTVPHTVHNNSTSSSYGSCGQAATGNGNVTSSSNNSQDGGDRAKGGEKGRKARRKQKDEEKNVVKAEDIEGYRGNKDIDSLLEFLGEEEGNKKKSKKTNDKVVEKNTKKVTTTTSKSDISKDDQKLRKKKEKSQEKESVRPPVTKKLSSDTIDNDVIEEDVEEDTQEVRTSEEPENNSVRQSISPEKVFCNKLKIILHFIIKHFCQTYLS